MIINEPAYFFDQTGGNLFSGIRKINDLFDDKHVCNKHV